MSTQFVHDGFRKSWKFWSDVEPGVKSLITAGLKCAFCGFLHCHWPSRIRCYGKLQTGEKDCKQNQEVAERRKSGRQKGGAKYLTKGYVCDKKHSKSTALERWIFAMHCHLHNVRSNVYVLMYVYKTITNKNEKFGHQSRSLIVFAEWYDIDYLFHKKTKSY